MKQFYLTEIVTNDKLIHQGIYFKPRKLSKRAILFIHGLTSTFYAPIQLLEKVVSQCEKEGYGFAAFNNRGHDLIAGIKKVDPLEDKGYSRVNGGAGDEKFEECIYDIDAGIDFLIGQKYSEIILVGHSTGATKVCYYAARKQNKYVKGVVLLSPLSDRLVPTNPEKRRNDLLKINRLIYSKRGDELLLGYHFFPLTPKRYVSLFTLHSNEDMFDYGDPHPTMKPYIQITKPLLVVFGGADESADRPVEQIKNIFDSYARSKTYTSIIITDALHSFGGKEAEVTRVILRWVSKI